MLSDLDLVGTIQDHDDVPEEPDSESDDEDVSLETSVPDSQLYWSKWLASWVSHVSNLSGSFAIAFRQSFTS